jgi:hypothetical protein
MHMGTRTPFQVAAAGTRCGVPAFHQQIWVWKDPFAWPLCHLLSEQQSYMTWSAHASVPVARPSRIHHTSHLNLHAHASYEDCSPCAHARIPNHLRHTPSHKSKVICLYFKETIGTSVAHTKSKKQKKKFAAIPL